MSEDPRLKRAAEERRRQNENYLQKVIRRTKTNISELLKRAGHRLKGFIIATGMFLGMAYEKAKPVLKSAWKTGYRPRYVHPR